MDKKIVAKKFSKYTVEQHLMKNYNLSLEAWQTLYDSQGGRCAICDNPETTSMPGGTIQKLAVDHNHKTGKVRGLLCRRCNTTMGFMHDDEKLVENMLNYLKKHR